MPGIVLGIVIATLAVGGAAEDPGGVRGADAIVEELRDELKASRPALPYDDFVRIHSRIVELVGELRAVSPDDPRVAEHLTDRWLSLSLLGERDRAGAEIAEVLATTADPALRIDALYLGISFGFDAIPDRSAAIARVESFVRQAPGDPRGSNLLHLAAERLDLAWYVRLGLLAGLAAVGGLILLASRIGPAGRRRLGKFALRLGLGLIAIGGLILLAFRFQNGERQDALVMQLLGAIDAGSRRMDEAMAFPMRFAAYYAGPVRREVWTVGTGLAVGLAAVGASMVYAIRRRRAPDEDRRPKGICPWALGFVAILSAICLVDAALIGLKRASIREMIVAEYPDSFRGRLVQGERRQRSMIGEPFALAFDDAITGRHVSMDDLRGKVVVVDFWATWCGPCVEEIPELKRLYDAYRGRGVEFIGVSLDLPEEDGGLESLRSFVAEEDIHWPQYYLAQGNRAVVTGEPTDDFAECWGISGIPALFVIDAEGRLHSTNARGKLRTLIPRLLKEAPDPGER